MNTRNGEIIIQMVLTHWKKSNGRVDKIYKSLTVEKYSTPVAPGANTTVRILAHLSAVSDSLFPLLNLGDQRYPLLKNVANSPKQSPHNEIEHDKLKNNWLDINSALFDEFNEMQPEVWFGPHTSVLSEDFKKEPHRAIN